MFVRLMRVPRGESRPYPNIFTDYGYSYTAMLSCPRLLVRSTSGSTSTFFLHVFTLITDQITTIKSSNAAVHATAADSRRLHRTRTRYTIHHYSLA